MYRISARISENIADAVRNSSERVKRQVNKLKQKFDTLKIRTKLTILLFVVGFVPVLILGISLSVYTHSTVVKNRRNDMQKFLQRACATVSAQKSVCEQMMEFFKYDSNVINFLKCSANDPQEQYRCYLELKETIEAVKYQNLLLESVVIYSDQVKNGYGKEVRPLKELLEEPWIAQAADGEWHYNEKNLDMISLYKMPDYLNGSSYAVVHSDLITMFQSFNQLATERYGIHVRGEDEIWNFHGDLCVDKDGHYLSFEKDESKYIWVEETIDDLGMNVYFFIPREEEQKMPLGVLAGLALQISCCLLLIAVLGRIFSSYISKPLEMLTADIRSVDGEKMEVGITSHRKDEIGILIRSYGHMMQRIQDLIQENYETKIAQKEFEMKALQAQINPHFLYNSLSMINWKAIEAGENEISKITLALSSFYRTTLNKGKTMNTIQNAVDNIKAYLSLQLYMHDNNFQVHYDIDPDTEDYDIPLLIFQPFVENALEHGLDLKEDDDRQIWIIISQDEKEIFIRIRDNGIGMDAETARHILEYDTKGYGVKNVNDRMKLHYGEEYKIKVESVEGVGTSVILRFPKEEKM